VKLDIHLYLVPTLRMSRRSAPPLHTSTLRGTELRTGTTLPSTV